MSDRALRDTPYKGLMPYSEEDEQFFFGREPEQEIITANLMASRFTLLYGPSGVGKSSVLRAGVASDLRRQALENLASRGKPRFVIVIFNEWKDDPLAGLLKQVRQSVRDSFHGQPFEPVPSNLSFTDELGVWAERVGGKLFIVLDQFEEYFLYPQKEGEGSFAVEFPRAVNRSKVRVNFLISIREDWLAKLDRFKVDIPNLFDNYLRIERLDRDAARNAIERPVAQYNKERAGGEPEVIIKNGFSERVLEQLERLANKNVLGESGRGEAKGEGAPDTTRTRIQTPYLQLVMIHLWNEAMQSEQHELHPAMMDDPDRAEKIVQSHLDEVMDRLNADEQEIASRVFHHLVTPSGLKIAQGLSDLAGYAELPKSEIAPMLDKLSQKESGLLSQLAPPPGQPNETRYEIFHDVLAPAILNWRTQYAQAQRDADAERREEEQRQRAEKEARSAMRFRLVAIALAVVSAFAVSFAILARSQQAQARQNARQALEERRRAEGARQEALSARVTAAAAEERAAAERSEADTSRGEAERAKTEALEAQRKAEAQRRRAEEQTLLAIGNKAEADKAIQNLQAEQLSSQAGALVNQGVSIIREENAEIKQKYEQALQLFRRTGNIQGQANTLNSLANVYIKETQDYPYWIEVMENQRKAIDLLDQALPLYRQFERRTTDHPQETRIHMKLAVIYDGRGDVSKAVDHYEQAIQFYRQAKNNFGERYAISRLAKLLEATDKERAISHYSRLLLLRRQEFPGDSYQVFVTLITLGDLHRQTNQKQKARDLYSQALPVDKDVRHLALLRLGHISSELGEKHAAVDYYLKVVELPVEEKLKAYAFSAIATTYYELNDKQKALEYLDKALMLYRGIESDNEFPTPNKAERAFARFEIARVLMSLSNVYRDLDEGSKALDYKNQASSILRELENLPTTFDHPFNKNTLHEVGEIYKTFGDLGRAEGFYRKAKEAETKK